VSYDDDVHPYSHLVLRRADAVLLDHVLAERRMRTLPGFAVQPGAVAIGHYVGALAPDQAGLRDRCNDILREAMRDVSLERIFRKWRVWNDDQPTLYARLLAGESVPPVVILDGPGGGNQDALESTATVSRWAATRRYLPSLVRASVVTLVLSCLSMALAVALGIVIATGRVYGGRTLRLGLIAYVELIRGTPILLQLFVLYYGLADAIRLPAFVAALLGLALNYAAYESEIYRAALEAASEGQLEVARTLGLSEPQILTLIRGPQALRLALAPMTNDFIALLKDSALVSVLTVMELTKQTQIFATNLGSWVIPGALCAALYLTMSLPLAALRGASNAGGSADTMNAILELRDVHLRRGLRNPAGASSRLDKASSPSSWARRFGQDDHPARVAGLEPFRRTGRRRRRLTVPWRPVRDAPWPGRAQPAAAEGRARLPVSLLVRAPVGARQRVPGSRARARRRPRRGGPAGTRVAHDAGRRAPGRGTAP
jgi:polar amino acid transport system substrate-binding protein